ncbi:MAG TPA: hypothetical protein VI653_09995, partial [Steroidobacteraceae bacterium]
MDFPQKWRLVGPTAICTLTVSLIQRLWRSVIWLVWAGLVVGCGSGGPSGSSPGTSTNSPSPVTKVTLVLS